MLSRRLTKLTLGMAAFSEFEFIRQVISKFGKRVLSICQKGK